ncbi:BrnA antitoxin family protein [Amaricoccus macauensis]|uniref:BrnA antitoxin family protein n=1 Tax=Amaricoccus macauensis TaxID=57001 RepID=UPI003C7A64FD
MTLRKRTKREERSYAQLLVDLQELEVWARNDRLKRDHIPEDWHRMATQAPVKPHKTRLTAAFDTDVVRWYRGLGRGYQARMNTVLRAYMLAVISKEIEGIGDRDWKGDPI